MSNSNNQPYHRRGIGRDRALLGLLAVIALLAGMTFARGDDRARADLLYQVSPPTQTPDPNSPVPTPTFTPTPFPTDTPTQPFATETLPPLTTDTPLPALTDTPLPALTDTPLPALTDTPLPTSTPTGPAADPAHRHSRNADADRDGKPDAVADIDAARVWWCCRLSRRSQRRNRASIRPCSSTTWSSPSATSGSASAGYSW